MEQAIEWEIRYQDTFDRECPIQVEAAGTGLSAGLKELWVRHLIEGLGTGGMRSFSRFHLWMRSEGRAVEVSGDRKGLDRLRRWMLQGQDESRRGYTGRADGKLLAAVAEAHARLILNGGSSEGIASMAADCSDRSQFERLLGKLAQGHGRD